MYKINDGTRLSRRGKCTVLLNDNTGETFFLDEDTTVAFLAILEHGATIEELIKDGYDDVLLASFLEDLLDEGLLIYSRKDSVE